MNYRALFFLSIIILIIGVGGLFLLPSDEATQPTTTQTETQAAPESKEKVPEVVIMTAVANRELSKGILLQADDYTLSELKVEQTSPLVKSDLTQFIAGANATSLQGFLTNENITAGSLLSENNLISPEDSRFIISSLDSTQEVAYRIYIKDTEEYILDTLRQGDSVSVFNQQQDLDNKKTDKKNLIKLMDNLTVLQVKKNKVDEKKTDNSSITTSERSEGYIGYVSVKINAKDVKKFYTLETKSKLIVLPSHQSEPTNHRGTLVRELRGSANAK
ncbi:flp operon protein C [Frederiksenia canicola]|uniref:Pilus assembly protein CpaB n=1 Tax=Frederiksenia canicola TaxID=123824 RepID=A0AAE6X380_9PAST|nr:flp operon protein C [Frederiksenia canicola]QIM63970.1 hypothetical protein A4G17_00155 [Frederiksenia canicola]RPE95708.1 pilus assembly protein CpaB [Frederiksenia canicola]